VGPRLCTGEATGAIGQSCAVVVSDRKLWLEEGDGGSPSRSACGADCSPGSVAWLVAGVLRAACSWLVRAGVRRDGTLGGGAMTCGWERAGAGSDRLGRDKAGDEGSRAECSGSLAGSERGFTAARPGRLMGAGGGIAGSAAGGEESGREAGLGTAREPKPGWVLIIRTPDFGASES
jgi:hypothetical protein